MTELSKERVLRLASLELSALRAAEILPVDFERARLTSFGTLVYDVNGEPLFRRLPVRKSEAIGYVDMAVHPSLGGPLLSASTGIGWNERAIRRDAHMAARRRRIRRYDTLRFVAYSYPKIAVQYLSRGEEVAMLEWSTWAPVPLIAERRPTLEPAHFERWSLLDELPVATARARRRAVEKRAAMWDEVVPTRARAVDFTRVATDNLRRYIREIQKSASRVLHFTSRDADHDPCFELRGQETNVWCVAASVQMFLEFWRYEYTQTRIANELGLGTLQNPNGLPYSRVGDVVVALEGLTSKGLDATMYANPPWTLFRNEIRANRPLISFVPGHSRAVAGYTATSLVVLPGTIPFRGLLVYDPWPPNVGVVTKWENFDTQTYQFAYAGKLPLV